MCFRKVNNVCIAIEVQTTTPTLVIATRTDDEKLAEGPTLDTIHLLLPHIHER